MNAITDISRAQALEMIEALARAHSIEAREIAARIEETMQTPPGKGGHILSRLFSYLGGALIFSGIGLLISFIWDDISSAQRVIVVFGTGCVAFILGVLATKDKQYEKAVTPFFLIAALLEPAGMFVFLDEYAPPSGDVTLASIAIFSIMALQQTLAFLVLRRTTLLFFACFFFYGALVPWMGRLEIDNDVAAATVGISMLCVCAWIARGRHRVLAPFGNFFGTLFLLAGSYRLLENSTTPFFLAIDAFVIYLSLHLRSRTILFVGITGLLAYLTDYTWEHFAHVVGWPIALIVIGFAFLGIGGAAVRLSSKIVRQGT